MEKHLSIFPTTFLNRMKSQLGDQFDDFASALTQSAPTSIRLNPAKMTDSFNGEAEIPWCPLGRELKLRPSFTNDPLFHAGAYYVQESSSMALWYLLAQLVNPEIPIKILDLSAAPGGKTTLLQSFLPSDTLIVANEVIGARNKTLRQNLARWGCDNVITTQNDPSAFQSLPDFFDVLLIDAPCSGEGLFRKDATAIKEWSGAHLKHCAMRQERILHDALPSLRPGGLLIYSTCTFNEGENEAHLLKLIETHNFFPVDVNLAEGAGFTRSHTVPSSFYAYPHLNRGEGFFIGVLKKPLAQSSDRYKRHSRRLPSIFGTATEEDKHWLAYTADHTFFDRGEHRIAMPKSILPDYLILSKTLYITGSGLNLGRMYHGKLRPSPELALSIQLSETIPRIALDRSQALKYLSHQRLDSLTPSGTGWHLATFQNVGLGWINVLKNGQIKNAYPTAWRILKPEV